MCKTDRVRDERKEEDVLDEKEEEVFAPMLKNLLSLIKGEVLASSGRCCLDIAWKPQDIDYIAEEIRQVFERCADKGSNILGNERPMVTIYALVKILVKEQVKKDGNDASSLLLLLRNTIATPSNLENLLLCMTDAETRTDSTITSTAFLTLHDLTCSISAIGLIKLKGGSCFFSSFISAICKGLDGNGDAANRGNKKQAKRKKKIRNQCRKDPKQLVTKTLLWHGLTMALRGVKEKATNLLDRIDSFNWPRMFNLEAETSEELFAKMKVFGSLHSLTVFVLQEDRGNIKAKTFLQTLGRCRGLFRSVLSSVIAGRVFSEPMPAESPNTSSARLQDIEIIMDFLLDYNLCLIPAPRDGGTFSLVQRAYSALEHAYKSCSAHDAQESSTISVGDKFTCWSPDSWKGVFLRESDQDCCERFEDFFLSPDDEKFDPKQWRKGKRPSLEGFTERVLGKTAWSRRHVCQLFYIGKGLEKQTNEMQLLSSTHVLQCRLSKGALEKSTQETM